MADRADAGKPNMGLTGWKGAKIRTGDVTIAKNYLNTSEMEGLNRIVTMYLDYADDQAKRHHQIFMRDWRNKLDVFLQFNERDILNNSGKVSKDVADKLALSEYEKFNQKRLEKEAEKEALDDDGDLKVIESKIEKRSKKKE
ncbi:MAG: RhuM family protein [Bacteriovorax sp.]|nr:RhuM family protein [Bacteriovorax sp.]